MGVKLVALDIDGTVIPGRARGEDARPSARLRTAIRALDARGIAVVLASGRMFPGTASVARELGLATPLICQQGCSVHAPDGAMLHEFPIEHRKALELVAHAREIDRAYEWFNPLRYIVSRESDATREYGRVSGITPEYRADPERSGIRPTGVGIISSAEEANGIHRALVAHHGESLHILDFPTVTVAVAPEANKGHALSLICADLGIDRHETVAVGDSVNDAPMLAWAGRGYAMPHSDRYALDAANEVLPPGDPEPIAALLELLAR
ncbi:MAG: HAD family phosphatase [Chloroflexi bacterium]|nr:HAD family phosphatase [Chloroflexota bacterium]